MARILARLRVDRSASPPRCLLVADAALELVAAHPLGQQADHRLRRREHLDAVAAAVKDNTKLIWLETPTNPALNITDIAAVAKVKGNAQVLVDNTFATPYLQNPLALGADHVLHSTTKYLGGHSDVLGGAVVTNDPEVDEQLLYFQGNVGAVASPFDAYLTARGIKTLGVRMDRHCANAQKVAEFLQARPEVKQVRYPGLAEHPGHELARRQMRGFGGMVSVEFQTEEQAKEAFRLAGHKLPIQTKMVKREVYDEAQ